MRRIFAIENRNYFLLLGTTVFLVIFGLVMVLSSSSIESSVDGDGFFGRFSRQAISAILGIPLMLVASRLPPRFWKRWGRGRHSSWVAHSNSSCSSRGLGLEYGGNQNWISIGGFNMQPSEFVKIALDRVGRVGDLDEKEDRLDDWKHVALPIGPVAGMAIVFVLLGKDLGTASIIVMIVLGCLYFGGVRLKFLFVTLLGVSLLVVIMALATPSRTERIAVWIKGCTAADYSNLCWQVQHASWALATGGLFGSGLGNSKAKWNWLPEADNDFIFAIIGEELGLIGALCLPFRAVRDSGDRICSRDQVDQRQLRARIVTGGVMVWVIGQAFVNIAVVLELVFPFSACHFSNT